uniref:Uncharacterized protein n=1 Tax=Ixodes ricinus TaxID=34613 RepID=A0A147BUU5_IXORI
MTFVLGSLTSVMHLSCGLCKLCKQLTTNYFFSSSAMDTPFLIFIIFFLFFICVLYLELRAWCKVTSQHLSCLSASVFVSCALFITMFPV